MHRNCIIARCDNICGAALRRSATPGGGSSPVLRGMHPPTTSDHSHRSVGRTPRGRHLGRIRVAYYDYSLDAVPRAARRAARRDRPLQAVPLVLSAAISNILVNGLDLSIAIPLTL